MTSATTINSITTSANPALAGRYGSIGIGAVAAALMFAGPARRSIR